MPRRPKASAPDHGFSPSLGDGGGLRSPLDALICTSTRPGATEPSGPTCSSARRLGSSTSSPSRITTRSWEHSRRVVSPTAIPQLAVDVVVGEEISTLNGHLIGLYLRECIPPHLPAADTIRLIHAQGGLAVAAHPFHPVRGTVRGHRTIAELIPDLALDAVEIVNNAGVFSWLYDAWAALANVEWALPVTGGSEAHDVWYVGNAVTRFAGRSAEDLRQALLSGVTRAHRDWSWTFDKLPRHLRLQTRALLRFLMLCRQRRHVASAP